MSILVPSINEIIRSGIKGDSRPHLDYLLASEKNEFFNGARIYHRLEATPELTAPLLLNRFDVVVVIPRRGIVFVYPYSRPEIRVALKKQIDDLEQEFPEWVGRISATYQEPTTTAIWHLIETLADLAPEENTLTTRLPRLYEYLEEQLGIIDLPPCHPGEQDGWLDQRFLRVAVNRGEIEKKIASEHDRCRLAGRGMRIRIEGGAGSGKTVAALQYFKKTVAEGKKALLVCYNYRLGRWLRSKATETGFADTLFRFARKKLEDHHSALEHNYGDHMGELVRRLTDPDDPLVITDGEKFHALIVDEGQDFKQEWADALIKYFLLPGGDLLWFEDSRQNIINKAPPVKLEALDQSFSSHENFRTPRHIAEYANNVLANLARTLTPSITPPYVNSNDLDGWPVEVFIHKSNEDLVIKLAQRIDAFMQVGIPRQNIVIVSSENDETSIMQYEKNGKYRLYDIDGTSSSLLMRYNGEYKDEIKQYWSEKTGVYCDSILKLKGLEDYAVILVFADCAITNPTERTAYVDRIYCALTRSKARLNVLVGEQNGLAKCFVEAISST